jgi:hypothetical protein
MPISHFLLYPARGSPSIGESSKQSRQHTIIYELLSLRNPERGTRVKQNKQTNREHGWHGTISPFSKAYWAFDVQTRRIEHMRSQLTLVLLFW